MIKTIVIVVMSGWLLLPLELLAEPQKLIFSHVVGADTPKGKMARLFKDIVETKLGDRYEVVIHENASLMSDVEAVDAIAEGRIHFAAPALSKFTRYTEKLKVFDLPFLFRDMKAVNRFQESETGQSLLTTMKNEGIVGLGYLQNGLKQLTANRPFREPSDLAGLRFRIINTDVLQKQFKAIDADPVPIAWPDTPEALRAGIVDGQENTWSNIFTSEFYKYQKYMMASNHGLLGYMVITNKDFWQPLTSRERRLFLYAMNMSIAYGNAVAQAKSRNDRIAIQNMKDIVFTDPTPKELARWQAVMRPIWDEYESVVGKDVINAARASSGEVASVR